MTYRAARQTSDQWEQLIKKYEHSGDTIDTFCRRHKLGLSTFNKWRRRYSSSTDSTLSSTNAFVEATPFPSPHSSVVTLRLGDALRVELPMTLGVDRIVELTQAMAERVGR